MKTYAVYINPTVKLSATEQKATLDLLPREVKSIDYLDGLLEGIGFGKLVKRDLYQLEQTLLSTHNLRLKFVTVVSEEDKDE